MSIKKKINNLYNQQAPILKQIESIRNSCPHNKTTIRDYMWMIGSTIKMHICDDCDHPVRSAEDYSANTTFTTNAVAYNIDDHELDNNIENCLN